MTPQETLFGMTKSELQNLYEEVTGFRADRRKGREVLMGEITKEEMAQEARDLERAEKERRKAEIKAERESRIAARGTAQDFSQLWTSRDMSDSERNFSYLVRKALQNIERATSELEKFSEKVKEHPVHALSWSKDIFQRAAEQHVARDILGFFEAGMTNEELRDHLQKEALRRARSPARSTSPSSNLMEECLMEAYAEVTERY